MLQPQETIPPTSDSSITTARDQLRLLGIFYIIFGLMALPVLAIIPLQSQLVDYFVQNAPDQEMVDLISKLATTGFVSIVVLTLVHIISLVYIGFCFRQQRHHTLCIIAAAFCCLSFPLGTILGVISLVVLLKPEAKQLYGVEGASL